VWQRSWQWGQWSTTPKDNGILNHGANRTQQSAVGGSQLLQPRRHPIPRLECPDGFGGRVRLNQQSLNFWDVKFGWGRIS
jgi:hypothetical protein